MDQQEDITHFQEQFNGPFPFNANGIIVALPSAASRRRCRRRSSSSAARSATTRRAPSATRTCTSGGATTSPTPSTVHVLQGGLRDHRGVLLRRRRRAARRPAPAAHAADDAAFEASLVNRFNDRYLRHDQHDVLERRAVEPDVGEPVQHREHLHAPGHVLPRAARDPRPEQLQQREQGDPARLRRRLDLARRRRSRSSTSTCRTSRLGCLDKLDAFFKQWWDTAYTGSPAAGNRPQITGPGLAGGGFYDANGGCSDYGIDVTGDGRRHRAGDAGADARHAGRVRRRSRRAWRRTTRRRRRPT